MCVESFFRDDVQTVCVFFSEKPKEEKKGKKKKDQSQGKKSHKTSPSGTRVAFV